MRALNFSKLSEKTVNGICHCEGLKRLITPSLRALATKQSHPSAKVLRLLQLLRSFAMTCCFARNDRGLGVMERSQDVKAIR